MTDVPKSGISNPPKPPPHYVRQDGPRPGGYRPLEYSRNVFNATPRNAVPAFLAVIAITTYGYFNFKKNQRKRMYVEYLLVPSQEKQCVSMLDLTENRGVRMHHGESLSLILSFSGYFLLCVGHSSLSSMSCVRILCRISRRRKIL